jgi:hypothetical protein
LFLAQYEQEKRTGEAAMENIMKNEHNSMLEHHKREEGESGAFFFVQLFDLL